MASRSPHGERGLKWLSGGLGRVPLQSLPSRGAWIEIRYALHQLHGGKSLPSRGAWIEIFCGFPRPPFGRVAPLTGGGGWNKPPPPPTPGAVLSLPSRGAWIEIMTHSPHLPEWPSRSPHGERGLKSRCQVPRLFYLLRRSPHGERGLKSIFGGTNLFTTMSLPSRGAWIEIL